MSAYVCFRNKGFCLSAVVDQEELMKTIKIPDETFEFLEYVARQDVTLPSLLGDYLKWDRFTKEEIKIHLHALNDACNKASVEPLK
jgi:hypothetical protein